MEGYLRTPGGNRRPGAGFRSQSDIEARMSKPPESDSIQVGRSAAKSGRRNAKIFVEAANRFLAYHVDRCVPVFPQSIAKLVVGSFVIGAIIPHRNDFKNSFTRI